MINDKNRLASTQKRPHTITKMNYNISMVNEGKQ
jgi:hypothetical protein